MSRESTPKVVPGEHLTKLLERNQQLRDPEQTPGNLSPWLPELQRWQSWRLAESYQDLRDSARYAAAAEFFLTDLYGDRDVSRRDADIERILPMMRRWLPESVIGTVALAVDLHALSHELDLSMVHWLEERGGKPRIGIQDYIDAYAGIDRVHDRRRQIHLIGDLGRQLDHWVKKPMLARSLRFARTPARLAGLLELQSFLERGFTAFGAIGGAEEFLNLIEEREMTYMKRLQAQRDDPFDLQGKDGLDKQ